MSSGVVSVIGSGNVGANTAFFIAEKGVTDVLLCDIKPGVSKGKALDIMEAAPVRRYRKPSGNRSMPMPTSGVRRSPSRFPSGLAQTPGNGVSILF